ncbi:hypothetical protein JM18_005184 [Phytophthora kernoviae]|uniref:Alcohol dehydrogenase-like N-terminal domain-containing protein n=1 Tax=Phytophthora kernoviae TaxID=325452 RepID=A0A922AJ70_9STRA|nr:hypothetical protein JM18_005184 [Phytophthora kernoviae]
MASPMGSGSSSSRRSSSDSLDSNASSPSGLKKRKLTPLRLQLSDHSESSPTSRKRRSILNDELSDHDMEDIHYTVRTPSKQMSIANLITSPPTPNSSDDSFWAATSALADVTIKPEKIEQDVDMVEEDRLKKVESPPMKQVKSEPDDWMTGKGIGDQLVVQLKDKCVASMSSAAMKRSKMEMDLGNASPVLVEARHNDAFVDWLRSDVIPMKAVQSQLFRDFLALVNPRFKLPQVIVQPQQLHRLSMSSGSMVGKGGSTVKQCSGWSGVGSEDEEFVEPRFMKGLCLQGNGMPPQLVTDLVVPTPGPQEALIEVLRAGICGTDLQMIDNYKPGFKGALGHEFVGIVRQLGAQYADTSQIQDAWIGKRVVGEINIPCNASTCVTCSRCTSKDNTSNDTLTRAETMRRNHCPNRSCLGIVKKDGAFAEYITLPLANLYKVPDGIMDSHAVFAEPLAAACRILEQQIIQRSDHVVVLGDGKLGLMVAEVLHATGTAKSVTLVGKHREKLALAKHFVNTVYTLNSGEEMAALADRIVNETTPFDVCVESTGIPGGIAMAVKLERKIDVQKYIHGVYPLERAEAALAHAATRGTLKIQFIISHAIGVANEQYRTRHDTTQVPFDPRSVNSSEVSGSKGHFAKFVGTSVNGRINFGVL